MRFFADLVAMLGGLVTVIGILVPTFALGFVLSMLIALLRMSPSLIVRLPAELFTVFFRGVPMLVVLYMAYYGFSQLPFIRHTVLWSFFRDPVNCAIFVCTINHTAFLSEVWRGAFRAVPRGIGEAAVALGLNRSTRFVKITFPLAFRIALSGYRNEIVMFVKSTSTVGAIAVVDVLAAANNAVQESFDPLTPLLTAAAIYWVVVQVLQLAFDRLERRLKLPG